VSKSIETGHSHPAPVNAGRIVIEWQQRPNTSPNPYGGPPLEFALYVTTEPVPPHEEAGYEVLARLYLQLADNMTWPRRG
jgi:hypothetical protein